MKRDNLYYLALAGIIILLIVIKIPHLALPYYWDEAWSYSVGVNYMLHHGLGLLPDAMPPEISRGHPLLFYFLASFWFSIFNSSPFTAHVFALFISICLLILIFFFCDKYFNKKIGITVCLILLVQPVFLVQSGLLLPEVSLAFFALLSFYFYFSNKLIAFIISASCMLFIKETGVVAIGAIGLFELINFIRNKTTLRKFLKNILIISAPVFLFLLYFIYQKFIYGWMFFPEHISMMSFGPGEVASKFNNVFAHLFIYQGRNVAFFITLLLLLYSTFLYLKKMKKIPFNSIIFFFLIYIFLFLVFSALNFFTPRYILPLLPPFVIIISFFIHELVSRKVLRNTFFAAIIGAGVYNSLDRTKNGDDWLGYVDVVSVHQQAVKFCEKNNWHDNRINTHFLMRIYLTNPDLGYLSGNRTFSNLVSLQDAELVISSNVEYEQMSLLMNQKQDMMLLKRFEENKAWTEIYRVAP